MYWLYPKKWKKPEIQYRKIPNKELDIVQFVNVENNITIANMIAQKGVLSENNKKPINYGALRVCLAEVNDLAYKLGASIHMPRIGTGLAGGD